jgi:hypothetical protein
MICILKERQVLYKWKFSVLAKNGTAKVNKIVEFRIGQLIYNPQFINKGRCGNDRPLQAIFWGGFFFQNESVLKVGLNWVGANSLEKKLKKDSISFSVIKSLAGKKLMLAVQTHFLF